MATIEWDKVKRTKKNRTVLKSVFYICNAAWRTLVLIL